MDEMRKSGFDKKHFSNPINKDYFQISSFRLQTAKPTEPVDSYYIQVDMRAHRVADSLQFNPSSVAQAREGTPEPSDPQQEDVRTQIDVLLKQSVAELNSIATKNKNQPLPKTKELYANLKALGVVVTSIKRSQVDQDMRVNRRSKRQKTSKK
ncbi:MAG: hypothetical protein BYD32DRAFT_464052 [Podila humilis]|nr:MAG: hypothetical protein BYD32DRAFT_464052 [Podila humilis]